MYKAARTAWTILTLASGPCAFLFLDTRFRGYFANDSGLVLTLCGAGIFLWSLFFLLFHQRYFPLEMTPALRALGAALLNGAIAVVARNGDFLYAGYSIFLSALLSHCVYFWMMCALFLIPRARSKFYYYTHPGYFLLPLAFAVTESVLLYSVSGPLRSSLAPGSAEPWAFAALAALLLDAGGAVRQLFAQNMFVYDTDAGAGERDTSLGQWALLTIAGILIVTAVDSFIMLGGLGLWRTETVRITYVNRHGQIGFEFKDADGQNRISAVTSVTVRRGPTPVWESGSLSLLRAEEKTWLPYGAVNLELCRQAASITGKSEQETCRKPPALEPGVNYTITAKMRTDRYSVEPLDFTPTAGPRGGGGLEN